jgi:hypothetical protein
MYHNWRICDSTNHGYIIITASFIVIRQTFNVMWINAIRSDTEKP